MLQRSAARAEALLPALVLGGLVLASYIRILPVWTTAIVSPMGQAHVDASLHLWQYEWLRHVLERGGPLFLTDGLTFPAILDLLGICEGYLDWLVAAPLVSWAGPHAASNAASLVHFALLAAGVYALCRALSGSAWAGATAAGLLVLSPSVLHEFGEGRVVVGCLGIAAFALVWAGRWVVTGRVRYLVGVLFALAVTMAGYLYSGPMLVLLLPCLAAGYVLGWRPATVRPRTWLLRGGLLALALALMAGVALAFASQHVADVSMRIFDPGRLRGSGYWSWYQQGIGAGLPLRDILLPMPLAKQAGSGVVLPLVALLSLAAPRSLRPTLPWWLGALVLHFAAMGTMLSISGGDSGLSSPYRYLPAVFPFLLRFHWPYRFLLLGDVCLAVLAAVGLASIGRWRDRSRWRPAAVLSVVAVGLAIAQAGWTWPFSPSDPDRMPGIVDRLAQDRPGAVLEVSAGSSARGIASWDRFHYDRFEAAIIHGAPMCCQELPVRLVPRSLHRIMYQTPMLAWLLDGRSTVATRAGTGVPIEALGFTHLVLHGHGCDGTVRPLDSFGDRVPLIRQLMEANNADSPASAASMEAARVGRGPAGGRTREILPERTCGLVVATLADLYGPPAAIEPEGDGFIAFWRLPRTPPLPAEHGTDEGMMPGTDLDRATLVRDP